jgi:RimJ/RimL family protein N-acetyltransferase
MRRMDESLFPPFGLRLSSGNMLLRVPRDDDLPALVEAAKAGIHDPSEMPFAVPWTDVPSPDFELRFVQHHWRLRSTLAPEEWTLALMVSVDGEVAGVQDLRATDFAVMRTVDTGSWLGRRFQRRGLGRRMREMVLGLAFDHLGAEHALSAAFVDNPSSQGVSRALGYAEDGIKRIVRRGRPATQIRFRMDVDAWRSRSRAPLAVEGLEPLRRLLVSGR